MGLGSLFHNALHNWRGSPIAASTARKPDASPRQANHLIESQPRLQVWFLLWLRTQRSLPEHKLSIGHHQYDIQNFQTQIYLDDTDMEGWISWLCRCLEIDVRKLDYSVCPKHKLNHSFCVFWSTASQLVCNVLVKLSSFDMSLAPTLGASTLHELLSRQLHAFD